jgi:hypothetical protein
MTSFLCSWFAGFVTLFTKYVGHSLLGFHCIVHEESFCAKAGLEELEVMEKCNQSSKFYFCACERGEFGVQRTVYMQ